MSRASRRARRESAVRANNDKVNRSANSKHELHSNKSKKEYIDSLLKKKQ